MLIRVTGRLSHLLTILASAITVVALAIDPFTQRSISFPSRSVLQGNMSASVGKTYIYDAGTVDDGSARNSLGAFDPKPCCSRCGYTHGQNDKMFYVLLIKSVLQHSTPTSACKLPFSMASTHFNLLYPSLVPLRNATGILS